MPQEYRKERSLCTEVVRKGFLKEQLGMGPEKEEVFQMHLVAGMTTGLEAGMSVANSVGIQEKRVSPVFRVEGI